MPCASVVIPCLNNGDWLALALSALDGQDLRSQLHVTVIDNGSTDHSIEVARGRADQVEVVYGGNGSSAARQRGLALTHTPLMLTLDADTRPVSPDWATKHVAAMSNAGGDVIASAGPLLPAPSEDWWARREDITPHVAFADGEPLYAVNGNACYRTAVLKAIGGYPNYGANDAAIGKVARHLGWRYLWVGDAPTYHINNEGLAEYYRQMRKVGGYTAEIAGRGLSYQRFIVQQARHFGSSVCRPLRRSVREAVAGAAKVVGQTEGSVRAWTRASSGLDPDAQVLVGGQELASLSGADGAVSAERRPV